MTDTMLKSAFTLDSDTQTYKPVAHNVSAAQAIEQLTAHENAKIVDQENRHRNPDPLKCRACKKAADQLTAQHTQAGDGAQEADGVPALQESEGD